jgi:hypothetical protein
MPVRTPGPTNTGVTPNIARSSSSIVSFMGGTTLATIAPVMRDSRSPDWTSSPRRKTPYSSAVRSGSVRSRQCCMSRSPS